MNNKNHIPVSKIKRAAKFATTGLKVGGNYLKHYGKKMVGMNPTREELHEDNANTIYDALSELKGSALKMIQMLSLDKNLLPTPYIEKFAEAQYKAPPLSPPLLVKTFKDYFGKGPLDIFDEFDPQAVNAASFGQVHKAKKNGKNLAVKIQYPGVGESVKSDLRLARPLAVRLFKLTDDDIKRFFGEVEQRLLEETDYKLEIERGMQITEACREIPNISFPTYYKEWSSPKVISMDWIEGEVLTDFVSREHPQEVLNTIGQAMWDFYDLQIHKLKITHADPHPGNFIIGPDNKLNVIDFGCIKVIPPDFYSEYFELIHPKTAEDDERLEKQLRKMQIIMPDDNEQVVDYFMRSFRQTIRLLIKPFYQDEFDFADDQYFKDIFDMANSIGEEARKKKIGTGRGSQHSLYISRTYFGLFNILNRLKAKVKTKSMYLNFGYTALPS